MPPGLEDCSPPMVLGLVLAALLVGLIVGNLTD